MSLFDHVRSCIFDRQKRPDQVDAQDFLPMFHGLLGERHQSAADPGIGPDRIEPPEAGDRLVDKGDNVVFGTGVGDHGFRGTPGFAHLVDGFLDALGAIDRDQLAPSLVKRSEAARPMPLPAPVMMTDLPSSRPMSFPLAC